jgi:hypothetical protein
MNVLTGLIGWIKLDDDVYPWNVKTTCSDIRAQQHSTFRITKFKKSGGALLLFLLTMQTENRKVDVIEKVGIKFNSVAAA